MKYLYIVAIAFFITSCCGTKETAALQPRVIEQPEDVRVFEDKKSIDSTKSIIETEKAIIKVPETKNPSSKEDEIPEPEHETTLIIFDHSSFNKLLQKHVSEQGNVNYNGFKKDAKTLRDYISSLGQNTPTIDWIKEDKLAYWINAYNAMTIDLILRNYPTKSIKDIDKPWKQRLWKLGEKWYNLDDIEHQIIRKMGESRIHFALVCAAKGCPKLYNKAFTPNELNDDLTRLTEAFLADTSKNNISENSIKLSRIFKWFKKDFEQDGSLIDFLNLYSDVEISDKAKKSFKDYNWDLND